MSMDGIRVNHGALDQAAADMQQSVTNIDDRLNRLEADLSPLRSDWSGSAQQAYHEAKARWDSAIGEMKKLLNETQSNVTQSNADYHAADLRGAGRF